MSGLDDLEPLTPLDNKAEGSRPERSRAVRRRRPSPVAAAAVALVALAAGALGWLGGRATAPSTGPARLHPLGNANVSPVTTVPPTAPVASTTSTIAAAEIAALGQALPIGYEGLPVPSSARPGRPRAGYSCAGSGSCSEEVFVLPAIASPATLVAWYDQQMGPTEIPWRTWQPCFPGNPADANTANGSPSGAERSWVQPGSRVLRLYLFAPDQDQSGPYVRITSGVESKCGDG